ncbi:ABC transporter substrate-binding protein [Parafrankia sp. FMc2]|uniref:ABC transporter substrate-binding protein n=1 Tax=Parafrankia sp. FMc2 TaxID=3233196 RepID=UPI0034D46322
MRFPGVRLLFRAAALSTAAAVLATAAACGGSDSGTDQPAADTSVLGAEKPASGEPVKIGFATTGHTQAQDYTDEINAAKAVVAYANERLGGIGGRPIELTVCEEKGTPANAQVCGNEFVRAGVAAISGGAPAQVDPWLQIVTDAGIPVGLNQAATKLVLGTPGVFVFSNPLAAFGTGAAYAKAHGLTSGATIVLDTPAGSGPAKTFSTPFFANVGATVEVVPIAPGTADMTPQIQAAQGKDPQLYHIIGDPGFCSAAIEAIKTLGIDVPITAISRCIGDDKGASIPGGFEGVTIAALAVTEPDDPEYKLYTAILDAYGDNINPNRASNGYQGLLSLIRAVNAAGTTDLTPAGIQKALQEAPATPYPLGGGATFQCDGKALPAISPNICTADSLIADAAADGTLSNFQVLDASGIYELPGT